MESLFLLVPMSLLLMAIALAIFVWSVKNRQYDDLDKEAHSILFDEDDSPDSSDRPGSQDNEQSGKETP